jgi:hypothetical protein
VVEWEEQKVGVDAYGNGLQEDLETRRDQKKMVENSEIGLSRLRLPLPF